MLLLMLCAYAGAIYAIFFKLGWLRWTRARSTISRLPRHRRTVVGSKRKGPKSRGWSSDIIDSSWHRTQSNAIERPHSGFRTLGG
jgi:hypothetical protein